MDDALTRVANDWMVLKQKLRHSRPKLIARIKGGLGNQLFCYAAARRLALFNGVELVLDDVTGFVRDLTYRRRYALDAFDIPCRKATSWERMEPFERGRRALAKWTARRFPFDGRTYIEQDSARFDQRLLTLKPKGSVYLDGYWQDERYFADVDSTIRTELKFRLSPSSQNRQLMQHMDACQAVALHVRWFDKPTAQSPARNLAVGYYEEAIRYLDQQVEAPHYFIFSDDVDAAMRKLCIPLDRVTCVEHNRGDEGAILDLWLMSHCKHFIMANSTFSWWGAWLGRPNQGVLLMPKNLPKLNGALTWCDSEGWMANVPQ